MSPPAGIMPASSAAAGKASQQQQQQQQWYQPLLFAQPQDVAAGVVPESSLGSWGTCVGSEGEAGIDVEDEVDLCVVFWEAQRSVALVHGNDAHLVSGKAAPAAASCVSVLVFIAARAVTWMWYHGVFAVPEAVC
jgi:hypothetical protein